MIMGNDVSSFQGDINYDVYKNNSNFVIIKATEGTGFIDPKFSRNQSEARRVGICLGYYHFARPDLNNSAQSEADWFLKTLGTLNTGEFLCLDYESSWSGDIVTWCKSWLDEVYAKTNCKPLIYLNQSLASSHNWQTVVDAGYGLWIAAYTFDPNNNNFKTGAWKFAAMQQWTDKQTVPGINGAIDGDVFFGDIKALKSYGIQPTPPPPDTTDLKNQIKELTNEIEGLKSQIQHYQDYEKQLASTLNCSVDEAVILGEITKDIGYEDQVRTLTATNATQATQITTMAQKQSDLQKSVDDLTLTNTEQAKSLDLDKKTIDQLTSQLSQNKQTHSIKFQIGNVTLCVVS